MTKSEIQERLKIPQRTLERLVLRCEEKGLLEEAEYLKSPNGGRQRDFSEKDFVALRDYRKSDNSGHIGSTGLARRGADGNGVGMILSKKDTPTTEQMVTVLRESFAAAIKAELYTDEIYKLKDLPIPRKRALAAIHGGRLKAALNHVDLGRGYRIKKSDWQNFLRSINGNEKQSGEV